jgi:hypothetical protein
MSPPVLLKGCSLWCPLARGSVPPRWSLSDSSYRSLLKAACPEQFPDKMPASPGALLSSLTWGSSVSCIPHRLSMWLLCRGLATKIGALVISPSCVLNKRATLCRPRGNLRCWPVYHNASSSSHWPASGFGGHSGGCHADDPLSLQHDQL